jgi:hypothetical protein
MRAGLKPVILFAKPGWILRGGGRVANLDIDFVNNRAWNNGPAFIASLLTCTRASSGNYTNADGTLQSFGSNVLRCGTNGLLVEEARTNLCLQSQTFDNASWTKQATTVSSNAATAPDGTATADKIVEDAAAGSAHGVYQGITVVDATVYTMSVYAKAGERTWLRLLEDFGSTASAYFNLGSGVVGTVGGSGTPSATITALASGWYRCTLTFTSLGTSAGLQARTTTGDATATHDGDGASGLYLWGAQLEAAFATSYIPTTTSSVARAADAVAVSDVSWLTTAAQSYYVQARSPAVSYETLFDVNDGTDGNDRVVLFNVNNVGRINSASASSGDGDASTGNTITANTLAKLAAAFALNDLAVTLNAGTVATDSSAALPVSLTAARLGATRGGSNFINGYMTRFACWNSRLSNSALQALTTPPEWVLEADDEFARLDIDFVEDVAWNNAAVSISSLLTCTRASSGYYTHADGTLESFGSNVLRYGTNGLLVEEARTNLFTRSQEFDNGAWNKSAATVSANATTAPDGTTTADKLVESATSAEHYAFQSYVAGGAGTWTWSVYVKAGERTKFSYEVTDNVVASFGGRFDISTGAVEATPGATSGNWSGIAQSITALANGWYRIAITAALSTAADMTITLYHYNGGRNYAGDGASGFYMWGGQLEAGAFATSYIPSEGTSVARATDVITFADLTWFDGASESLYAEWIAKNVANATVWALDATNDVTLNEQSGMSPKILDAGATFAITVGNTAAAAVTVKAAARMATNDIALCMNGGTVGTDTSATQPGTLSAARLGIDLSSANALNGYIRRVAAWKSTLLSNGALQSVST